MCSMHLQLPSLLQHSPSTHTAADYSIISSTHHALPACPHSYQQALQMLPTAPAEVRLGIAACYLKLGNMDLARAAYERVIKLDPSSAMAYLGLAAISFNSENEQQGLADGVKLLVAAYQLDPSNTAVLALLAQVCLMRGEYDKARDLALAGCEAAGDVRAVRAQCFTLAGRACHALGLVQEAGKYYHQVGGSRAAKAVQGLCQRCLNSLHLQWVCMCRQVPPAGAQLRWHSEQLRYRAEANPPAQPASHHPAPLPAPTGHQDPRVGRAGPPGPGAGVAGSRRAAQRQH
jgi:Tfp pilus assembly protein PilF